MTRVKKGSSSRKSRARHFTPPPGLIHEGGKHPETPSRLLVLIAKRYAEVLNVTITADHIRQATGVPDRVQRRIFATKSPRTLHNQEGPDPRGRRRGFTRSDTRAIGDYLDDPKVHQNDKGKPWKDIAKDAGVILPDIPHSKPIGLRSIGNKPI